MPRSSSQAHSIKRFFALDLQVHALRQPPTHIQRHGGRPSRQEGDYTESKNYSPRDNMKMGICGKLALGPVIFTQGGHLNLASGGHAIK